MPYVLRAPLRYPGKVLADPAHDRLYIADSGYHRIVITPLAGQWVDTIGAGQAGYAAGRWEAASFNQPQGMARSADGSMLYIADTTNHLIRRAHGDDEHGDRPAELPALPHWPRPDDGAQFALGSHAAR